MGIRWKDVRGEGAEARIGNTKVTIAGALDSATFRVWYPAIWGFNGRSLNTMDLEAAKAKAEKLIRARLARLTVLWGE